MSYLLILLSISVGIGDVSYDSYESQGDSESHSTGTAQGYQVGYQLFFRYIFFYLEQVYYVKN